MDERMKIINELAIKMSEQFSNDQIKFVKDILLIQLNNYHIAKKETGIVVYDDNNIKMLEQFIVMKKIEGKSEKTLKRYYSINKCMLNVINKPIKEITTFDLRCYLMQYQTKREQVSNRTLDGMRRCIRSFFTWLTENDLLQKNPSLGLSQIKYTKVVKKPYSDVDLERIKRSCVNLRDRALVEFLYSSGCRISEVASLNQDAINFQTKSAIVHGKGDKERIVYLSNVALMYLDEYLQSRTDHNECLFAALKYPYNRLSTNGIGVMLRKLGATANVSNVHAHRYRRTLATNLLDKGASIQDVAQILGHDDIKTTQIYCFISQENVKATYNKYI